MLTATSASSLDIGGEVEHTESVNLYLYRLPLEDGISWQDAYTVVYSLHYHCVCPRGMFRICGSTLPGSLAAIVGSVSAG